MSDEQGNPRVYDLGYARLDLDRVHRRGFPEVVYGEGKTQEELVGVMAALLERHPNVLATRVDPDVAAAVQGELPELRYEARGRVLYRHDDPTIRGLGTICVVCAGTSDRGVASEAELCARVMGNEVDAICDVGVAGLHRLLAEVDRLRSARIVICVAGMEAALPSVVAGLLARPVIAVPTSVGYGAHLGGLAALLGCLNSCAAGVTTVNIDNGFGAAYAATLMNRP